MSDYPRYKVAYVAGKYRGMHGWDTEANVREAEKVAYDVAQCNIMPCCPHTNTRFFDGTMSDDFWLGGTLELMLRCDVVIMVHNWKDSKGAIAERQVALEKGIPVVYSLDELKEWHSQQA